MSKFSQTKADEVIRLVGEEGVSLRKACKTAGVPRKTFSGWLDGRPELQERYQVARDLMLDVLADEIVDLADEADAKVDGRVDAAFVQAQRLKVDARKWVLSKLRPETYGDRLKLDAKAKIEGQVDTCGPLSDWLASLKQGEGTR